MEHEINFVGKKLMVTVAGTMVPAVGDIVQIAKRDYKVKRISWAVDREDARKTLRAIVELDLP